MKIKVDSKVYESNTLEIIDSINHLPTKDWVYFTETLYLAPGGEFILETEILLNDLRHGPVDENGVPLTNVKFEPEVEHKILTESEAKEWIGFSVLKV